MTSLLVVNADLRTQRAGVTGTAMAVRDGVITCVGDEAAARAAAGPAATIVDAGGATVLPGFIDAHQHPAIFALYGGGVRLAAPGVTSIPELQARLAAAARALPAGRWVLGLEWDEATLRERRAPTRAELDAASPDNPVFAMHYTCHRAIASSRALELAGIDRHTPDPYGGVISRGVGGLPDGLLVERALCKVEALARADLVVRDAEGFLARLGAHFDALARAGITRVADAAVPADLAALYREAQARGLVTIPTVLMPVSVSGYLESPLDALSGPPTGEREGNLVMGPVKMVLDGAPGCALCMSYWQAAIAMLRTWALVFRTRSVDPIRHSLSVKPRFGRDVRSGIHVQSPAELDGVTAAALDRGYSVACHAEGNVAIESVLAAYEREGARLHAHGTARVEHVVFADAALCRRLSATGAAGVMQPHFLSLPSLQNGPEVPGLPTIPLRSLLDAGVVLAGSSDFPVTGFDPLDGIRSAVTRRSGRGVREADQAITVDEAFAMYTREAARVLGCLDECGTLEPGKRADVVLLDRRVDGVTELAAAAVARTWVAGREYPARAAASSP